MFHPHFNSHGIVAMLPLRWLSQDWTCPVEDCPLQADCPGLDRELTKITINTGQLEFLYMCMDAWTIQKHVCVFWCFWHVQNLNLPLDFLFQSLRIILYIFTYFWEVRQCWNVNSDIQLYHRFFFSHKTVREKKMAGQWEKEYSIYL